MIEIHVLYNQSVVLPAYKQFLHVIRARDNENELNDRQDGTMVIHSDIVDVRSKYLMAPLSSEAPQISNAVVRIFFG